MMCGELVKRLRETSIDFGESDHVSAMMIEAADAIEELKKQLDNAEIENIKLREEFAKYRGKHRWISVKERLPDAGKKVLVFAYGYDTIIARMCKKTESGYPVFECKGYDGIYREIARTGRITHWMPLPEKPEVM